MTGRFCEALTGSSSGVLTGTLAESMGAAEMHTWFGAAGESYCFFPRSSSGFRAIELHAASGAQGRLPWARVRAPRLPRMNMLQCRKCRELCCEGTGPRCTPVFTQAEVCGHLPKAAPEGHTIRIHFSVGEDHLQCEKYLKFELRKATTFIEVWQHSER